MSPPSKGSGRGRSARNGSGRPAKNGSSRAAKNGSSGTAKNGSSRAAKNGSSGKGGAGHRRQRVDLELADLEILLKACTSYGVSLPSYLASAQDDVARTQALVDKLGDLMKRGAN